MHPNKAAFGGHSGRHNNLRPRLRNIARCTAALRASDGLSLLRSSKIQQKDACRVITQCAAHAAKSEVSHTVSQHAATEAAANAAGAAAATAEAAAASTSATSSWFQALSKHAASMRQHMKNAVGDPKAWQAPKFEMPGMRVDVDMLNPALTTLRNQCRDFWISLPPPLRQAAPYGATASATFLVTRWVYAGRLRLQEAASKKLQDELVVLQDKLSTLQERYQSQQSQLDGPRAMREVQMAQAVAQATSAAAAAATAASSAAEAASLLLNNKVKVLRA